MLTIRPQVYEERADAIGNELPHDLEVHRAFGLNAARELSVFRRYPAMLALPDRWATWRMWAVPKAMEIIRTKRVDAIWSTFPIATAHRIGLDVSRRVRVPWLAEFRDPMWQPDWPIEPMANRNWKALERDIFAHAAWTIFTAPSAVELYSVRFPEFDSSRRVLIENGYDEETFGRAEKSLQAREGARQPRPITLVHSGIIYRSERDPSQFFAAVAALKQAGRISAERLQIVLRASGEESDYLRDVASLGIADIVRLEPGIDYLKALQEMLMADGLLLLQASNCNAQVPAKLYEYLRAGRPILALTDPAGDTAKTLKSARTGTIAHLDDADEIARTLLEFLGQIEAGLARCPAAETIAEYSRERQTERLAHVLDLAVVLHSPTAGRP